MGTRTAGDVYIVGNSVGNAVAVQNQLTTLVSADATTSATVVIGSVLVGNSRRSGSPIAVP